MNTYEARRQSLLTQAGNIPVVQIPALVQSVKDLTQEELAALSRADLSREELTVRIQEVCQFNLSAASAMHALDEDFMQYVNCNVRSTFRPDYRQRETALQLMLYDLSRQLTASFGDLPRIAALARQFRELSRVEELPYRLRKKLGLPCDRNDKTHRTT